VLPVGWLIVAVVAAVLLTLWIAFTLTRLDRLHARVDAAYAALDAQLVRRAVALLRVAETPDPARDDDTRVAYERLATHALAASGSGAAREEAENAVGRAVRAVRDAGRTAGGDTGATAEVAEAAARVQIARRFYNDAVRDTRALRARRLPRLFRMAGHREMPQFFDIDDDLDEPTTRNAGPDATVRTREAAVPTDEAPDVIWPAAPMPPARTTSAPMEEERT
jgi:hypothetical protein